MRELQAARGAAVSREGGSPSPARYRLIFAGVALAGLAADAITKAIAVASLDPRDPRVLLDGLLTLRLLRNAGAAFSQGERFTVVFAVAALAVLVFVVARLVPRIAHSGWAVALGLLCAGVGGNLLDRLIRPPGPFRGHVVDFLQLPYWPVFNVADMCITAAAVMIVLLAVIRNVGVDGRRPGSAAADARGDVAGGDVAGEAGGSHG